MARFYDSSLEFARRGLETAANRYAKAKIGSPRGELSWKTRRPRVFPRFCYFSRDKSAKCCGEDRWSPVSQRLIV